MKSLKMVLVLLGTLQFSTTAMAADLCEARLFDLVQNSMMQGADISPESTNDFRMKEKNGVVTALISVYSRDDGGLDFDFEFEAKRLSAKDGADCKVTAARVMGSGPEEMYADSEYAPQIHSQLQKLIKKQK